MIVGMRTQAASIALLWIFSLTVLTGALSAQTKALPRPGEVFAVNGRTAFVIQPPDAAQRPGPMPWVWYAPTLKRLPGPEETWMFDRFLTAGI